MGVNVKAWFRSNFDADRAQALPALLDERCPGDLVWIWDEADPRRTGGWGYEVYPSIESIAEGVCMLNGPGLILHLYPRVFSLWSLARWRGFITIPQLRSRLREVTWRIAEALGADDVIWLPDWALDEIHPEEHDMESLRDYLTTSWGVSQPSLDPIEAEVLSLAERESPQVWFEETRGDKREAREAL